MTKHDELVRAIANIINQSASDRENGAKAILRLIQASLLDEGNVAAARSPMFEQEDGGVWVVTPQ